VFLRESEVDGGGRRCKRVLTDCLRQDVRATEVSSDCGLEGRLASREVLTSFDGHANTAVDRFPVWAAVHGARAKEGQWVKLGTGVVDGDVPQHILADLLGKVDVYAKEVGINLGGFDFLEQALEPSERGSVTADPEELDTLKSAKIALPLPVPDMLQDGGEGSDADTSTDEDSDLSLEHILSRSTVRTIDTNDRHGLRGVRVDLNDVTTAIERVVAALL